MTILQLKYSMNKKLSRALCAEMESLIELADLHEKMLNTDSLRVCVERLADIKMELNEIWDEQTELYFMIIEEHKQEVKNNLLAKLGIISFKKAEKRRAWIDY